MEGDSLSGLHRAVWDHDIDEVQRLVDAGANVSETVTFDNDHEAYDPLNLVWQGHHTDVLLAVKCIDILVAGGLVPTFKHLYRSIRCHPKVFKALLDHGTPIWSHENDRPLLMSIIGTSYNNASNAIEIVRLLLEFGADPNQSMPFNYASVSPVLPIHQAIYEADIEILYVLLEHGADPYAIDAVSGMTSLGWARHTAAYYKSRSLYDSKPSRILQFFENIYECQNFHARHWESLKKDLIEAAWHPVRLQKLGYFDVE